MRSSASLGILPGRRLATRLCAIAALVAIGGLCGCATEGPVKAPLPPVALLPTTPATHPLAADQPDFLHLPSMAPGHTPVRVGLLLPFSNGSAATRALASSIMKAAELALFDAHNPDIVLMSADEGSTPDAAAAGARQLLAEGAEVIVGPLFSQSVAAVAPIARDRSVPVIALSTDRSVAGDGVYLLSFQPENEIKRILSYAASQGKTKFGALVPRTVYGERVTQAFQNQVTSQGGTVSGIQHFDPTPEGITAPTQAVAADAGADAILVAQGGALLRAMGPALMPATVDRHVKLLGTGLWDDPSILKEGTLQGAWLAAPSPDAEEHFDSEYRAAYASTPPQLATLGYDAVSLVAVLASGTPYHRFTAAALDDPNGFAGVDGIFRFNPDGTSERGLAILEVQSGGFTVVAPAPTTFQPQGS